MVLFCEKKYITGNTSLDAMYYTNSKCVLHGLGGVPEHLLQLLLVLAFLLQLRAHLSQVVLELLVFFRQ